METKPQLSERITQIVQIVIELEAYKEEGLLKYRPSGRIRTQNGLWFDAPKTIITKLME